MNAVAELFPIEQPASQSIAVIVAQTPEVVLIDAGKRDDLYAHIRREVEAFTPDLTTNKGRDAITALAFKITRTKTAIDAAGKKLNEEARAKIGIVDAARRDARETLDQMAEDVRRPLTEWKEAEKARETAALEGLAILASMSDVSIDDTAETVAARLAELSGLVMNPETYRDGLEEAEKQRVAAVATLQSAHDRLVREEADRAELAKLRAEAAERERMAVEKAAEEEAERQRVEAARREEERQAAAAKADAERIQRAQEAAAQAARDEEARKAREAQEAREREHEAALAAERAKAAEAERLRQAEADRIAQIEREREATAAAAQAEAERVAAEQARREKNRAHRGSVMGEAKTAIMSCGVDEPIAKAIVLAIVAGTIPHTTIQF